MLLATKLSALPVRPGLVPRSHLVERLDAGLRCKLTLVAASAGFGKTTLASMWLHGRQRPFAWLSLDERDNDPVRFWNYVIAALQTLRDDLGRSAQAMLQQSEPPSWEVLVTTIINDAVTILSSAGAAEGPWVLVIDDYHVIRAKAVHQSLDFFLDHLPPCLHLVVTTRVDPPLSLPRRRSRKEVHEVRTSDLRFRMAEVTEFLNGVMHLDLSGREIAALEARTEGWATSLHLAALSLDKRKDRSDFIASFTGNDRHVVDYLVDEVFSHQPENVQRFLLHTAILERFCGSLCDAVVGDGETSAGHGQNMLEHMERANLFLVPLDTQREWYRYHHLFAELLRSRLHRLYKNDVVQLHRRAGAWFEAQSLVDEALHHILAAKDYAWAARLVERVGDAALWEQGAHGTVQRWLAALPDEVVRARPKLCLLYAWPLYSQARLETLDSYLLSAEAPFQQQTGTRDGQTEETTLCADEKRTGELKRHEALHVMNEITALRTLAALPRGNISHALHLTEEALSRLPMGEVRLRAILNYALGQVHFRRGEMNAAEAAFTEATALGRRSEKPFMTVSGRLHVILTQTLKARFREADETCRQLQRQLIEYGTPDIPAAAALNILRGWLFLEWNDLEAAEEQVMQGLERSKPWADERLIFGHVMWARVLSARGNVDDAHLAFEEAAAIEKQLQFTRFRSNMPPVAAYRARLWLAHGNVAEAARWVREQRLGPHDKVSFRHEVEHLTLARLLIAQNQPDDALHLLERLRQAAEAGGRAYRAIEARVLEALALHAQRKTADALEILEDALRLTEPERLVRLFLEEGLPMARLLYLAANQDVVPDFARTLLAAFTETTGGSDEECAPRTAIQSQLIEPLTERELEVLTLIAEDLSNQEISDRLFISINTVKTHIRNVYGKLGTSRRSRAVAQAHALGLLRA